MLQITEADFSATEIEIINAIRKAVSKALGAKPYELRLCKTEGGMPVKYIQLHLPLKPENGTSSIQPIEIALESNLSFSYTQSVVCVSPERGYTVANAINDTMRDLPIKCIYVPYGNYFEIMAVFQTPDAIIALINGLLCCHEFLIVLSDYMDGTATENEENLDFETLAASGGYVNHKIFEDYNLVKN